MIELPFEEVVVVESIFKDWETHTWDEACTKEWWVIGGEGGNKLGVDSLDIFLPKEEGITSHKACGGILFCKVVRQRGLVSGVVDWVGGVWSMEEYKEGMLDTCIMCFYAINFILTT